MERTDSNASLNSAGSAGSVGAVERRLLQETMNKIKRRVRKTITGNEELSVRHETNRRLREEMGKPKTIRLMDRIAFCLGVFTIIFTQYIIMQRPTWFAPFYCCVIPTMVGVRYKLYRRKKMHYFLIDFCYFVQFLLCVNVALHAAIGIDDADAEVPDASLTNLLFKVNFLFANGPIAIAIVAWRNSLVFHSLDKVTSVIIHGFPMCLTFCERWFTGRYAADAAGISAADFGVALLVYAFWQSAYLLETEVRIKKKFDADDELSSSLRYLAKHGTGIPVVVFVRKGLERLGLMERGEPFHPAALKTKLVMVTGQLLFTLVTMIPSVLCFQSYAVHIAMALLVMWWSVWNGATYYFEVFAGTYKHAKLRGSDGGDAPTAGGGAGVVLMRDADSSSHGSCSESIDVSPAGTPVPSPAVAGMAPPEPTGCTSIGPSFDTREAHLRRTQTAAA